MTEKISRKEEKVFIGIIFGLIAVISISLFLLPLLEEKILSTIGETSIQTISSVAILALVLGLIDGFNPCAMWVLIYLISLVSELKDKRKMWLIVGTFLGATGVMYFIILYLYMFGWSYLAYIGYAQWIVFGAAIFAIGSGAYFVIDYIKTKGKVECKVGDFKSRKKTMDKIKNIVHSPFTIPTFIAIALLAFSINLIEFICSIGIPQAFTGVLVSQDLGSITNFFMICIYILTFLADDLLIFYLALKAIDSPIFDKYTSASKILGGILMLIIGFVLLQQIILDNDFTDVFLKVLLVALIIFLIKLIKDYYKK